MIDKRDRVDRNDDGSPDDIVIMLEPDLMLRAEKMDDGLWWVAINWLRKGLHDDQFVRTVSLDLYRTGKKRFAWHALINERELLPDDD